MTATTEMQVNSETDSGWFWWLWPSSYYGAAPQELEMKSLGDPQTSPMEEVIKHRKKTAEYYEDNVRHRGHQSRVAFWKCFPKSNPHLHLDGSLTPQQRLELLMKTGKEVYDPKTMKLYKKTNPKKPRGCRPIKELLNSWFQSETFYHTVSTYDNPLYNHQAFFDCWEKNLGTSEEGIPTKAFVPYCLENAFYEKAILVSPSVGAFEVLGLEIPKRFWDLPLDWSSEEKTRKTLQSAEDILSPCKDSVLKHTGSFLNQASDLGKESLERITGQEIKKSVYHPSSPVCLRFKLAISRNSPPHEVLALMIAITWAQEKFPNGISSNELVGPEFSYQAGAQLDGQMKAIASVAQYRLKGAVTVHAGELTPNTAVSQSTLCTRMSRTIGPLEVVPYGKLHLGHGVSLPRDEHAEKLAKEIRKIGATVEVCLSSNKQILGMDPKNHSVRWYLEHDLEKHIVLGSDDPGVALEWLSDQYALFGELEEADYETMRTLLISSIERSQILGSSIYKENPEEKSYELKDCVWKWMETGEMDDELEEIYETPKGHLLMRQLIDLLAKEKEFAEKVADSK